MHFVVTAGPTYESLDEVRRLTNFSTGKFGTQLANFLAARGHQVTLLLGYYAIHHEPIHTQATETYTTTDDLGARLQRLGAAGGVDAVFHAAAVSDFKFGKIWERTAGGELIEAKAGKISTRSGTLLAELVPTVKLIANLRQWYPNACLVGWKYEVDGGRADVLAKAERQIAECRTNACVANGKAYGLGFGLVRGARHCEHIREPQELYAALEKLAGGR
ncbi:MAG TPA: phosphopantothenoylcysteine decarboxylase [Verrucomicrobiae bacterium]|jgi:phosphopantothenoylcysteine decarboxylase/phosphopantothenate--cysteine ligase